jgi:RND family efflux transporter MFP subunit
MLSLIAGATAVAIAGCNGDADAETRTAPTTTTAAKPTQAADTGTPHATDFVFAESTTVRAPLVLPSQLYVEQDAIVAARAGGVLQTLSVDLGTAVHAGQVLGRVEDAAQRLALTRASVTLDNMKTAALRMRELGKVNGVSVIEMDQAEFQLRIAEVAKKEAELAVERVQVIAPFDGVVTARYARPGTLLSLNDTLLRVTARGPHLARVRVPESASFALRTGGSVAAISAAGDRFPATIVRVSPVIDAASGTREIVVELRGNRMNNGSMITGSSIMIELAHGMRRALTVPRTALSAAGYVLVARGEGTRTTVRPVVPGAGDADRVEILAGLQANERVRRFAQ